MNQFEKELLNELRETRKELQNMCSILESIQEYVDIKKASYLHNINNNSKKVNLKINEVPINITFQEVLKASRQYSQGCL